jgi:hypothetical protein
MTVDADAQMAELNREIADYQAEKRELDMRMITASKQSIVIEERVIIFEVKKPAAEREAPCAEPEGACETQDDSKSRYLAV